MQRQHAAFPDRQDMIEVWQYTKAGLVSQFLEFLQPFPASSHDQNMMRAE